MKCNPLAAWTTDEIATLCDLCVISSHRATHPRHRIDWQTRYCRQSRRSGKHSIPFAIQYQPEPRHVVITGRLRGTHAGRTKGDLLHWIYRDYKEHNQKVEKFSTIAAQAYFELGIKSSILKIIFRPTWAFFKAYFLRLGFLDGKEGFIIAKTTAYYTFLKYRYLKELNNNS